MRQSPVRLRTLILTVLTTVALLVPTAVWASHQFTDVPDSNVFHNAIGWMKDNGITVGCNPPANTQYCPSDNVSRGQMAAFMKRLAENQVVDAATAVSADNLDGLDSTAFTTPAANDLGNNVTLALSTATEIAEVSLTAPANGGLVIDGVATPGQFGNATGQATLWLQVDNATCTFDSPNFYPIDWGRVDQTGNSGTSASVHGAAAVNAGAHTVTFCGEGFDGAALIVDGSLVAQFVSSVAKTGALSSAPAGGGGPGTPSS
ncbi:MAG: S-layer homology domain-containing protein [Acidimicrobiia bacterium]